MRSAARASLAAAGLLLAAASTGAIRPADCRDCHAVDAPTAKRPALNPCPRAGRPGDRALSEAPETMRLGDGEGRYGPVEFAHRTHAAMAATAQGCAACHHHSRSRRVEACAECHSETRLREDVSLPDLRAARHRLCIDCHSRWEGREGACASCHESPARERRPRVAWLGHRFHQGLDCADCHRKRGEFLGKKTGCRGCHPEWPKGFRHETTGVALDELHRELECAACHAGRDYTRPRCSDCHDDRSYPAQTPGRKIK
jgi:hypothetical protein